jgi:hypothetical protein
MAPSFTVIMAKPGIHGVATPSKPSRPSPLSSSARRRPTAAATAASRGNVVELLPPGSFVRLRNQPADLPPFQLIQCRGGRCWVRQQAWGSLVQWEVAHGQLTRAAA